MATLVRKVVCLAMAAGVSFGASAVKPAFQDYANGHMMLAFTYDADVTGFAVQVKGSGETEWSGNLAGNFTKTLEKKTNFSSWTYPTNFVGSLSVRVAMITEEGTGEFEEINSMTPNLTLSGTALSSSTTSGYAARAFNGEFDVADTTWIGMDFGAVRRISKIRYIFRFGEGILAWTSRWGNSKFQISDDPSFSVVSNIATVSTSGYVIDNMREFTFDPPIETRCVRHYASSGFSSLAEMEIVTPDLVIQPKLTVRCRNTSDFYPLATWTIDPLAYPVS